MARYKLSVETVCLVLGFNRTYHDCRNMAVALSLHPWRNTTSENVRLRATKWALRHWHAYQLACDAQRNRKGRPS